MTCEVCGNDFHNRKPVERDNKKGIICPYCKTFNAFTYNNKKGGKNNGRRDNSK